MIERDLAHLRFLNIRSIKGDYIQPEDMEFVELKKQELETILCGIDEIIKHQADRDNEL